jgi:hypothetical protein
MARSPAPASDAWLERSSGKAKPRGAGLSRAASDGRGTRIRIKLRVLVGHARRIQETDLGCSQITDTTSLPSDYGQNLLGVAERVNGIFYLVGLIVVAIIVVYAFGHW